MTISPLMIDSMTRPFLTRSPDSDTRPPVGGGLGFAVPETVREHEDCDDHLPFPHAPTLGPGL